MKKLFTIMILSCAALFFLLGFQCGSPELTSAKLYIQQKNWDKALEAAEKEVKSNPKSVEGWFVLGNIRGEKKDWKGMVDAFNECLKVDPQTHKKEIENKIKYEWAQAFNSGVTNINNAKNDKANCVKAIDNFKTAIILQPDSIVNYQNLAFSYQMNNDMENVLKTLTEIIAKKPDYYAYERLGAAYVEKGNIHKNKFDTDNKEKLELSAKLDAIEKKISKETVRKNLGEPDEIKNPQQILTKQKITKKNTKDSKKNPNDQKDTKNQREEWIYNKYNLHIFFEDHLVTEKKFDPEYRINIDSSEYAFAKQEYVKAIDNYTKALTVAPDSMKVIVLDMLSQLYLTTNQRDIAIGNYKLMIEKDPVNPNPYFYLGDLYFKSKDFESSANYFKKVIEIKPQEERAYYNLFAVYNNWAVKVKDENSSLEKEDTTYKDIIKKGLPYIKKLIEINPDKLEYIDSYRSLCSLFGDKPELEKLLIKIKDLEPKEGSNPFYWEIMGKLYGNLNNLKELEKSYEKADQLRKMK
jgi:tetratricopeptide (TPR) repeat protein